MSTLTAALPAPAYMPRQRNPRISFGTVALIIALHGGLLAYLIARKIAPAPREVSALMVEMIQATQPEAQPQLTPPKPKLVEPRPATRRQPAMQPTLAAQAETAVAATTEPVANTQPAPTPAAHVAQATHIQPRFDADYLANPPPHYPPLSRRMGEEGKVQLRVFVDTGGRPSQIELKSSSGSPRLDQAAQDAIWRWKFVPARRGDDAIAAWVLVPIVFTLKN
jgi:protein TonB